ncbi:MAG: phosphoserine phosphatase SerB [Actinomycetes bacterium]
MSNPGQSSLLVTVTGRDKPGVTSALFDALARHDLAVLDVEQVVIRGRLVLGVLLRGGHTSAAALTSALTRALDPLGMDVEVSPGDADEETRPRRKGRSHVTVLGHPLRPEAMAGIAGCVADYGGNIDRIVRIARYPVTAVELEVSGVDPGVLRQQLSLATSTLGVDIAVERSGLHRRAKRLVVLDVDSTLVQGEVIEMLAEQAGCAREVAAVTESAMRGDLDFAESLRQRVGLLAGLDASALDVVRRELVLAAGARTFVRTLKRLDYRLAIVSGGFTQVTDKLVSDLGIDYSAANTLEIVDGRLTGGLVGPIVDRAGKADALERFAADARIPLAQTVAIGDGANDLDMLARAGLGIAFNAKPVVRQAADTALTVPYLDAILFLLGISREEIETADAEEGIAVETPPT